MALGKAIFGGDGKKYYRSEYKFSATNFATKIAEEIPVDDGLFPSARDPLVYALDTTLSLFLILYGFLSWKNWSRD
jgi:hypothetical protein